jgi:hypothetical protein
LSEPNDHASFSFALSETPPPARSEEESPLGDLDLDLGDFADVLDASEPPPEARRFSSGGTEGVKPPRAIVPGSFLDPFQVSSKPEPSVEAPELLGFDLTPVGSLEAETPLVSVQIEAPLLEGPLAASSLDVPPQIEAQAWEPPAETASEKPKIAGSGRKSAQTESPRVKKIQFPSRGTNSEKTSPAEAVSARPTTRFAESIAPSPVRAKFDSESEPEDEESGDLTREEIIETGEPPQAAVEDLPDALHRNPSEAGWGAETPTAREIWKAARKTWGVTSKHALALGGQGLRAGRILARETNEKLRARLVEGAKKAAAEAQDPEGELPFPHTAPSGGASVTGRVILGLARSTGKKLAAPLSAVAAAALVYFGGTHLLGTADSPALSKSAPTVSVPDLGSLREAGERQPGSTDEESLAAGEEATVTTEAVPKAGKAPAMQAEETAMPDGLSWPGKGLIEVVTSEEELIYVDGVFTGRGPLRRIPVSPGEHEVSIRSGGFQRTAVVQVTANRNMRAVFSSQ